jgi:hypothetical protein
VVVMYLYKRLMLSPSGLAGSSSNGRYPASIAYYKWLATRWSADLVRTHQNYTTTPYVNLPPSIKRIAHDKLWRSITRTAAAGLHQVASPSALFILTVKPILPNKVSVAQIVFNFSTELFPRIERIGKAKVCDDDISILVEKQILEFQIAVNNAFLVEVAERTAS